MDILLALVISTVAALIPTIFYVMVAWWLDRYEKEPVWLLTVTFLWGAIPAIIVSLIAELALAIPIETLATGQGADVIGAAVVAPVVEEIAKAIPLLFIFRLYRKEFDGLMDGLLYGSLVGFGFSMTENIFYFIGAYTDPDGGGWEAWGVLVFLRAFVFGLNHALFTSAFGVGLGYARYARQGWVRKLAPLVGLAGAIALHAIHNFFVSFPDAGLLCFVSFFSDWLGVLVWLLMVFLSTRQEKQWIQAELAEEVAAGLLPADQAQAAASYRERLRDRWAVMQEKGFGRAHRLSQLHNAAADLALKKRQLDIHGDTHGTGAAITALRVRVQQLVQELA